MIVDYSGRNLLPDASDFAMRLNQNTSYSQRKLLGLNEILSVKFPPPRGENLSSL